ncbi:MAG: hypothetical protein ACE5GV_15395 [Candidatus Scalindua sp.]
MKRKKTEERVTLFAAIQKEQYEFLRTIAFNERKSLAEVTREALDCYIKTKKEECSRRKEVPV